MQAGRRPADLKSAIRQVGNLRYKLKAACAYGARLSQVKRIKPLAA
jgi:hypothetical protein